MRWVFDHVGGDLAALIYRAQSLKPVEPKARVINLDQEVADHRKKVDEYSDGN